MSKFYFTFYIIIRFVVVSSNSYGQTSFVIIGVCVTTVRFEVFSTEGC